MRLGRWRKKIRDAPETPRWHGTPPSVECDNCMVVTNCPRVGARGTDAPEYGRPNTEGHSADSDEGLEILHERDRERSRVRMLTMKAVRSLALLLTSDRTG